MKFSSKQQDIVWLRQNECDSDAYSLSIVKMFIELLNIENIKDFEILEKQFLFSIIFYVLFNHNIGFI